ncbi:hypothetical protein ACFV4P_34370 [Kitasatospora sp. NPDC059795]|uniref:hypothetical protein n=1 Tax=Kitasatospora sp. NPDC059795 TaxID=3346949 RepID=UPI0036579D65
MTTHPAPRPPLWQAVMAAAADRCQCTGTCGRTHQADGGRCPREHRTRAELLAAPADPARLPWPAHRVAALPAHALAAWCTPCHDAARTLARRAAAQDTTPPAEPAALF